MKTNNNLQDPTGRQMKEACICISNMVRVPVSKLTEDNVFVADAALNAGHISTRFAEVLFNYRRLFGWSHVLFHISNKKA